MEPGLKASALVALISRRGTQLKCTLKEKGAMCLSLDCHVPGLCTQVGGGSQRKAAKHSTGICPSGSAGTVGKEGVIPATDNNLG